jgi:hypothetical protein
LGSLTIAIANSIAKTRAVFPVPAQNILQRTGAAAMTARHRCGTPSRLLQSTAHHFVRNRTGKEYQQIGTADLFFEIGGHFGKHFGFVPIGLADLPVSALHTLIASDDDYAHRNLLCATDFTLVSVC